MPRAVVVALTFAAACAAPAEAPISYRRDVQPIWDRYCEDCHFPSKWPRANLPPPLLEGAGSHAELTARTYGCIEHAGSFHAEPMVLPGRPEDSGFLRVLGATEAESLPECDHIGSTMPRDGPDGLFLRDPSAFAAIERWIAEGALDN